MDNIDDELQFHLDEKVRDLMAQGLSRDAATARADASLAIGPRSNDPFDPSSPTAAGIASGSATGWDGARTCAMRCAG